MTPSPEEVAELVNRFSSLTAPVCGCGCGTRYSAAHTLCQDAISAIKSLQAQNKPAGEGVTAEMVEAAASAFWDAIIPAGEEARVEFSELIGPLLAALSAAFAAQAISTPGAENVREALEAELSRQNISEEIDASSDGAIWLEGYFDIGKALQALSPPLTKAEGETDDGVDQFARTSYNRTTPNTGVISDAQVDAAIQGMLEAEGKTGTHYRHLYERLARAALQAALPHQDGWRLVPVEPTPEIVRAAYDYYNRGCWNKLEPFGAGVWKAMLSVAPLPPAKDK